PGLNRDRFDFSSACERDDFFQFSNAAEMGALSRQGAQNRCSDRQWNLTPKQPNQYQLAAFAQSTQSEIGSINAAHEIHRAVKRTGSYTFELLLSFRLAALERCCGSCGNRRGKFCIVDVNRDDPFMA